MATVVGNIFMGSGTVTDLTISNQTYGYDFTVNGKVRILAVQVDMGTAASTGMIYPRIYNATGGALIASGPGVAASGKAGYLDLPLSKYVDLLPGTTYRLSVYGTSTVYIHQGNLTVTNPQTAIGVQFTASSSVSGAWYTNGDANPTATGTNTHVQIALQATEPLTLKYLFQDGTDIKKYVPATHSSNFALSKPATASSTFGGASPYAQYLPGTAVDGKTSLDGTSSGWLSNAATSEWWKVDLGSNQVINRYRLYNDPRSSGSINTGFTVSWKVYVSTDDVNWTLVDTVTGISSSCWTERWLAQSYTCRYVKIQEMVYNTVNSGYVGIGELELTNSVSAVGWSVVGPAPVTQAMFDANGVTDLSIFSDAVLRTLISPKLLTWTDDLTGVRTGALAAVPRPRVVFPVGDINLKSVDNVDSFTLTANAAAGGLVKVIASVDSGATWKAWGGTAWVGVDTANLVDVKAKGMDKTAFNGVTSANWMALIGTTGKIRFAYSLEIAATTDTANTDLITMQVDMKGSWDGAILGTEYKYGYPNNTTLRITILANGDFKMNY